MKIATRWPLAFALLLGVLALAAYELREFRRAAAPLEKLIGRPVHAAGGDVGKLLGRRALERLDLSGRRVDDKTLAELKPSLERLPWLDRLSLAGARISGGGLAALANLNWLRSLDLKQTPIGDKALVQLGNLVQLESLDLTDTAVGDRGIAELGELGNLRTLWLGGTKITDRSIDELARHEQLEIISVANTRVTAAGIERLEKALPYCTVIR
jgi:Leucine-rich repeat (LRR) protein